ncbi:MAG: 50S ribosomal protein L23 [Neisseriales bacterium]|nr:MAG: 50S ribosomal protein L23 [Neisseriales bacterium]
MKQERLIQIIFAPVISEKSTLVTNKYQQSIFRVAPDATKLEIKAAIELLFNVKVRCVSVVNIDGKRKRFGRVFGYRKSWKKAYISLMPGQTIDAMGSVKAN